jgi:hypothetical protein
VLCVMPTRAFPLRTLPYHACLTRTIANISASAEQNIWLIWYSGIWRRVVW